MTELEQLLAREEIRDLKSKYCRGIDTQDWEMFAELFTDDAVMDMSATGGAAKTGSRVRDGKKEILDFLKNTVQPGASSVHKGIMGEITLTSDSTAEGIWAGSWDAWFAEGYPLKERHGTGYYYERYRRENGRWLIEHIRIGSVVHEQVIER